MKRMILTIVVMSALLVSCTTVDDPNKRTKKGAATGAAAGAIAGAIIGHQSGNRTEGAAVGAAVGAGVGALIGRRMDKQQQELEAIPEVEVTRPSENEIAVVLKNDVLFDVNSAVLQPESRQMLRDMSEVFARYPDTRIQVEGHADSTGSDAYNQALSERRASGVGTFLAAEGVAPSRIVTRGYGESSPRASNLDASGRQLNRRVEIRILAQQG